MDRSRLQEFVALDVDAISRDDLSIGFSSTTTPDAAKAPPKALLKKAASMGAERKAAAAEGGGESFKGVGLGTPRGDSAAPPEKGVIVVHSPLAGAAQARAASFRRRRGAPSPPWRDPRRVLLFFATLSSMGTMILLYFTLSMG